MTKMCLLRWLTVVLCMSVIFFFSSQNKEQSDKSSKTIAKAVKTVVEKVLSSDAETKPDINTIDSAARKLAHFSLFVLLGFAVIWAADLYFNNLFLLLISLSICIIYAVFDETHQHFVPGRAFQVSDILTDVLGSLIAVSYYYLIKKSKHKKLKEA
jgi:VanZ family protein